MKSNLVVKLTSEYKKAVEREWSVLHANETEFHLQNSFVMLQERFTSTPIFYDLSQALNKNRHLVFLGEPGSGKSTTLQFTGLCFVHEDWHETKAKVGKELIPIKITLQEFAPILAKPGPTMEHAIGLNIREFLRHIDENQAVELFRSWLDQGNLLLLLDGLDEIPDKIRGGVRDEIYRFFTSIQNNPSRVIVSSRPGVYSSLGSPFKEFNLIPFHNPTEAKTFLKFWMRALRREWTLEKAETEAEHLIRQMKMHPALQQVLDNPLLLRISAQVYTRTGEIAGNRSDLYRQYINDLWERALKRGADSSLEVEIFSNIELLAWQLHTNKPPDVHIDKLRVISEKMGLVTHKGDKLTFGHTTLQEYFVGKRLAKAWQTNRDCAWAFLRPRLHLPNWREPILLMGGSLNQTNAFALARRIYFAKSALERQYHRDKILIAILAGEGMPVDQNVINRILRKVLFMRKWWGRLLIQRKERVELEKLLKLIGNFGNYSTPTLIKILNSKDYEIQEIAIEVIQKTGTVEAIPELIKLLNKAYWWFIRASSLIALGSLKAKEALPDMLAAIKSGDDYWGSMGAMALGKMKAIDTLSILMHLIISHEDWLVKEAAANALGYMGNIAVPSIREALSHENSQVRQVAIKALKETKLAEVILDIKSAIKDKNEDVRREAIRALQEMDASEAIPELRYALINDTSESVRSDSAFTLGELKAKGAIMDLARALEDESTHVQDAAARALKKLGATKHISRFISENQIHLAFEIYKKNYPSSIYEPDAQRILEYGSEHSIRFLRQELKNNNEVQARWAASIALNQLNVIEAISDIRLALNDENNHVRYRAIEALEKLNAKEAIPDLINCLKDDEIDNKRRAAIALGNLHAVEAIASLKHALENKDLQFAVATALGKLKVIDAIPYLRKTEKKKHNAPIMRKYTQNKFIAFFRKHPYFARKQKVNKTNQKSYADKGSTDFRILEDLVSNMPIFNGMEEKKFYISELNKLKRDGIEERLVTERLEELKIVDSPYQDPFEPIKPSKSLKVAKTTLIILSITLIILLLAILTPFYGAAEDIIKDIISQPIGMWISAYPGVSILIFLGTGIILGFLIWLLEWLKNKF